ncbi:ATP-binding protein [Pseudomonas sp. G5001]|nr:ATP-binding protein [Pseudomonas sp. G5001]
MRGEGLFSASSAVSLISSASKGLLNKLLNQQNNANLIDAFKSLSFLPSISFIFKPAFFRYTEKWDSKNIPVHYARIESDDLSDTLMLDERYAKNFNSLATEIKSTAKYAMSNLADYFTERKALSLDVDFMTNECFLDGNLTHSHIIHSIQILMDVGLVRLIDLQLHKEGFGELNLRKASSGEQCLIVLMLGIAGHIENGSLILIDEPEISLHPRWQEEFMRLLTSAFEGYHHCQFIIATHSPQVISRLNTSDSYIYSFSKEALYESNYFNNKSADFQLAELFDAPGLMNEYISRVSFNLIAKLRTRKKVDSEIHEELQKLLEMQIQLSPHDPTIQLIDSVRELYYYYASN